MLLYEIDDIFNFGWSKLFFPHIFDGQNYSKNQPFYLASLQPGRNTTSFRLKPWLLGEKLAKVRGISTANVGEPWGLNQPNMELETSNSGISSAKVWVSTIRTMEIWRSGIKLSRLSGYNQQIEALFYQLPMLLNCFLECLHESSYAGGIGRNPIPCLYPPY